MLLKRIIEAIIDRTKTGKDLRKRMYKTNLINEKIRKHQKIYEKDTDILNELTERIEYTIL